MAQDRPEQDSDVSPMEAQNEGPGRKAPAREPSPATGKPSGVGEHGTGDRAKGKHGAESSETIVPKGGERESRDDA